MMGVVPVVPMGAGSGSLLDVRWLSARVRREVGAPMVNAATGGIALTDAVRVTAQWQTASVPEPKSVVLPVGVREQPVKELLGGVSAVGKATSWLQEPSDAQQ
jgi:hypothetical protein